MNVSLGTGSYFVTVGIIATPFLFGLLSVLMLAQWWTAVIELMGIAIFCYFAVKRHNKYHHKEKYNDQRWKPREPSAWG